MGAFSMGIDKYVSLVALFLYFELKCPINLKTIVLFRFYLLSIFAGMQALSLNTATVKQQCTLEEAIKLCVKHGIPGIGPWRDKLDECGVQNAATLIKEAGLQVSGLCRGGFFTLDDELNMDDNKKAVDDALAIGADCLVIVSGGLTKNSKNLKTAHEQITEGLQKITEYGLKQGMPIALEPLHPMYAPDRCAINTLGHALDICDQVGEGIGVAIDAYHVWWDPDLDAQIKRAGLGNRILGYHVCDWLVPTQDLLLDRGMMGDGIIDLSGLTQKVKDAGYRGMIEVEIFSKTWWAKSSDEVAETMVRRFKEMTS